MRNLESTQILDGIVFGEGPRWRNGYLWFSDIWGHKIMKVNEEGDAEVVLNVPERPSGLGWLPDGTLIYVSMADRTLVRLNTEGPRTHCDVSNLFNHGINDMLVDRQGRAYVGGHDLVNDTMLGKVAMVTPQGKARIVAEDLGFPNGAVITPDGDTYIVADTPRRRLVAFTILPNGNLTDQRVWAQFDRSVPDGICLDAEGAVWIGSFSKSEFLRVREGGEITDRIETPGKWSVACTLGGADGKTLFMMTAITSMADLPQGKSAGFVEVACVDVPGAGSP